MQTWRDDAACADVRRLRPASYDWFSDSATVQRRSQVICHTECPVRLACLQHALALPERYGTWGGADEETRRRSASVNESGAPHRYDKEPACAGCGGQVFDVVRKYRNRTIVRCPECDVTWTIWRAPKTRAPRVQSTA